MINHQCWQKAQGGLKYLLFFSENKDKQKCVYRGMLDLTTRTQIRTSKIIIFLVNVRRATTCSMGPGHVCQKQRDNGRICIGVLFKGTEKTSNRRRSPLKSSDSDLSRLAPVIKLIYRSKRQNTKHGTAASLGYELYKMIHIHMNFVVRS